MYLLIKGGRKEEVTSKLQGRVKHNFIRVTWLLPRQCKISNQHAKRLMHLDPWMWA